MFRRNALHSGELSEMQRQSSKCMNEHTGVDDVVVTTRVEMFQVGETRWAQGVGRAVGDAASKFRVCTLRWTMLLSLASWNTNTSENDPSRRNALGVKALGDAASNCGKMIEATVSEVWC